MQAEIKRGPGRPRKEPLPSSVLEKKGIDHKDLSDELDRVAEKLDEVGPSPEIFTAIGLRPCQNRNWIFAKIGDQTITIRARKSRKSPKNQPFQVIHITGNQYEEIR